MSHAQLAAALIAAPFFALSLIWIAAEAVRIRAEAARATHQRRRRQF